MVIISINLIKVERLDVCWFQEVLLILNNNRDMIPSAQENEGWFIFTFTSDFLHFFISI